MEKNYRYALRKTTLGVGSVAIGVFLAAGQLETVQAAEAVETAPGTAIEAESPVENVLSANTLELAPEAAPQAVSAAGEETAPAGDESSTDNEVKVREGVSKTEDGQVMTDKENSVSADENKVGNYRDSDLANNGITGKFIKEDNGSTQEGGYCKYCKSFLYI